jgi:AbrB family looped-hinge helix DNA binding protein
MKLTSKGQVTIPRELREQFGLRPASEVVFEATAEGVLIKRAPESRQREIKKWLAHARGSLKGRMTTDELMRLTRAED